MELGLQHRFVLQGLGSLVFKQGGIVATLVTGPTIFSQATDADYRIAIAAYKDLLTAVNPSILTQTADTGQVDVTTVVRPALNTRPNYLMFKFDDGLGPALYLKLCIGSGGTSSAPAMHVEFGLATDGAGNITTEKVVGDPSSWGPTPSWSSYNYACCAPGTLSFVLGQGGIASNQTRLNLTLCRFSDSSGNWTTAGILAMTVAALNRCQAHNLVFGSGRTALADSSIYSYNCYVPFSRASYSVGGVFQPASVHYLNPHVETAVGMVLVCTDIAVNTEFDVAVRGVTPRRYRLLSQGGGPGGFNTSFASLWE